MNLLIILPLLASCSLTPLYTNKRSTCADAVHKNSKLQIKIHALAGESYSAFKLKNILEQKKHIIESFLNQKMLLKINITEDCAPIGIDNTGDTLRNQNRIVVDLTISPIIQTQATRSNVPTKIMRLDSVSSYNLEASDEFSNEAAKSSVRERLLIELSEQIIHETID